MPNSATLALPCGVTRMLCGDRASMDEIEALQFLEGRGVWSRSTGPDVPPGVRRAGEQQGRSLAS